MGCFNTILVPCPKCGHKQGVQSKAGSCEMNELEIHEANLAELQDVVDEDIVCMGCGRELNVNVRPLIEVWLDNVVRHGRLN